MTERTNKKSWHARAALMIALITPSFLAVMHSGTLSSVSPFGGLLIYSGYSNDCYKEYLSIKIKDGQADKISCPAYKCTLTVPEAIVKTLVDEDAFKKYNSFLANSYVENNPYVMWCPAPGRQHLSLLF